MQKQVRKQIGKMMRKIVPPGSERDITGTHRTPTIQEEGYILGKKLIERKHSKEKNKGGQT